MSHSRHLRWGVLALALVLSQTIAGTPANAEARSDVPKFVVDPYWPKPLPERWITQEVGAVCVDSKDHVFTLNRGNRLLPIEKNMDLQISPPVIEYDQDGKVVNAWGDRDKLPIGQLHGCFFDSEDNMWTAAGEDGVLQKWTHDGSKLLLQIGTRGKCDSKDGSCTAGNATTSGGLNQSKTSLNRPTDITVDPSNGEIYASDGYGNHRVVVFDRTGRYLRQWGSEGIGPGQFSPRGGHPHCVLLYQGLLYVCDRNSDRVQVFDKKGSLKEIIPVIPGTGTIIPATGKPGLGTPGSAADLAFSPDNKYMYIGDNGNTAIWIYDLAAKKIVGSFGRPGHGVGALTSLHAIATDSKGNIYAGEVTGRRIQKFVPKGFVAPDKLGTFKGYPHYEPLD
jgi:DNA-binding beta-propeller fold protein YncE